MHSPTLEKRAVCVCGCMATNGWDRRRRRRRRRWMRRMYAGGNSAAAWLLFVWLKTRPSHGREAQSRGPRGTRQQAETQSSRSQKHTPSWSWISLWHALALTVIVVVVSEPLLAVHARLPMRIEAQRRRRWQNGCWTKLCDA